MAKRRPSGDGMVCKRDDDRWEGRIVVGHKDNGDPIVRYVYADTQKELTAKLRHKIEAYRGVDLTEQSGMTLSEWLNQWMASVKRMIRPSTFRNRWNSVEKHIKPRLGSKKLSQLTPRDIRFMKNWRWRAAVTGRAVWPAIPSETSTLPCTVP